MKQTPKELTPSKISNICRCTFDVKDISMNSANELHGKRPSKNSEVSFSYTHFQLLEPL